MGNIGISDEAIQNELDKNGFKSPDIAAESENVLDGPTCLYRHFDADCNLLYVGISLTWITRLRRHRSTSHWFDNVAFVTIDRYETRHKAVIAEDMAIALENPKYNIRRNLCGIDHNFFDPEEAMAHAKLQSARVVARLRDMKGKRLRELQAKTREILGEVATSTPPQEGR